MHVAVQKASISASKSPPIPRSLSLNIAHRFTTTTATVAAMTSMTKDTLETSKIIPDLIDNIQPNSSVSLNITFPSGKHATQGNLISPPAAADTPTVSILGGVPGHYYTLLYTDPDPPDPDAPRMKEWLHWIMTDIPVASAEVGAEVKQGKVVTPHMGPSPPIGTHRYVFMLFEQPEGKPLHVVDPSGGERMGRAHFSTKKFARQYGLGDPVAVDYFLSHK